MKDHETRRMEMLVRTRQYVASRASAFPADSRAHELLTEIDAAISDLEKHTTAQASGERAAREKSSLKSSARDKMREEMEAMSRTARRMARAVPGVGEKFRLPRSAGDQEWLAAARSFLQDAEPIKQEFIRRGFDPQFLEQFAAHIEAFEQTTRERAQEQGARVAATAAIDDTVERGMEAVRELDAVVRNTFRDDPAALAEWTSASHVERAARAAQANDAGKDAAGQTTGEPHGA